MLSIINKLLRKV